MVRRFTVLARVAATFAALITLVSCNHSVEQLFDGRNAKLEKLTFVASRDIALDLTADRAEDATRTRTTLGEDGSIIWNQSDAITVFSAAGQAYQFDCKKLENNGLTAVFTGKATLSESYCALSPAKSDATFNTGYGDIHAAIPSEQTAIEGSFDPSAALAVASTTGGELHFKNVGALVNFVVRDDNVKSITLSGAATSSNAALAGGADINYNGGNPVFNVTSKSNKVTLSGDFVKGKRYYLVVFPDTYQDLQLVFTDGDGRTATFSNPVALALERNSNVNLFDQEIPEAKWLSPAVSMAATIEVDADGVSVETSPVTLIAADGWNASVTYDGCVDYAYYDTDNEVLVYSVSKNETAVQRTGSITVTLSKAGYQDVTATASVIQAAGTPTPPVNKKWNLVIATSALVPGDEYVIACNTKGVVATDFSSGAVVLGNVATTFSSDKATISELPSQALIFTLGGTTDAWTLSNSDGIKLGATTTKKLAWGDGTATWKIAVGSNGTATIQSTKSEYGALQYNASSPRFTTYTSSQTAVQLYHRSGNATTSATTAYGATSITSSSATVAGSYYCVTAVPAEAGFMYGISAEYLSEKATVGTPSTKSGEFETDLTGLYAGTTYYFKAYVIENGVTYYGSIQNFTTNTSGGIMPSGGADYGWPELPAQTDKDRNGIDDNNSDFYYSHTFRADAASIRNFSCCYSKSKIHPVWVAAPMHNCYLGSSGRNDSYKADPNIKCTQNGKFEGYTRGHMVGSSDRTVSVATNKQAFYYSNIGAQLSAGFNTGGGVWNNLENQVDSYLCADTLYQVIGCIFNPFTDHYGESQGKRTSSGSDIPTAYYKALLRTKAGNTHKDVRNCTADELQCVAFIVIHNSNNKGRKPSSKDLYSIAELESMTGLTFFVNVPNAPKNNYKASDWGL